jgi:hypothetical protein
MSATRNRELSQFGSFIHIDDNNKSIGITTGATPFVGIGTTNATSKLHVVGNVSATAYYGDGSNLTGFAGSGSQTLNTTLGLGNTSNLGMSVGVVTATDFNSASDINLKENIKTIENSLNTIEQLRGVTFNWKENQKPSLGVIAQEVQEILPELVNNGTIKSVNYNGIIGVLIEAIKELKKEVEELKNTKYI